MKPNAFIVGAPKCGTTALADYLSAHPDVCVSVPKEPNFYLDDLPAMKKIADPRAYEGLFDASRVRLDASVHYLYSSAAVKRIAKETPYAKILILIREPYEFVVSWHGQMMLAGNEDIGDIGVAWDSQQGRAVGRIQVPKKCRAPKYLQYKDMASFSRFIDTWRRLFDSDQVFVATLESMAADARSLYLDALGFLGVPDDGRTDFPRVNTRKTHRSRLVRRLLHMRQGPAYKALLAAKRRVGVPSLDVYRWLEAKNLQRAGAPGVSTEVEAKIRSAFASERQVLMASGGIRGIEYWHP